MKLWHWKSHWKFWWHWSEITLKNIYKGNLNDDHTEIFPFVVQGQKKKKNIQTEKFSALLISFVPRIIDKLYFLIMFK